MEKPHSLCLFQCFFHIYSDIVCIGVSTSLKNTTHLSGQAPHPLKSANCPSPPPPIFRQSPLYVGILWPPPPSPNLLPSFPAFPSKNRSCQAPLFANFVGGSTPLPPSRKGGRGGGRCTLWVKPWGTSITSIEYCSIHLLLLPLFCSLQVRQYHSFHNR